ncbi:hypothetical protein AVEN_42189-1 [Araneus ventricosus]|uniref:Uncharacterized protein n=1 Tax=Araneus ventricosus TaxID=182803 RepID=A0A4Y2B0E9_ARAVE|nr:hypothetical protein AVEN_42189-1 [Araneus ventricosus]
MGHIFVSHQVGSEGEVRLSPNIWEGVCSDNHTGSTDPRWGVKSGGNNGGRIPPPSLGGRPDKPSFNGHSCQIKLQYLTFPDEFQEKMDIICVALGGKLERLPWQ